MFRKTSTIVLFTALLISSNLFGQQRYLSEIFTDVTITQDVQYGTNISVITGMPATENLTMDVYEPVGDTEIERPVILVAHDGGLLPPAINGFPYGAKDDSASVQLCMQLAKRGFVAISYNYRLGWNPNAIQQDDFTGTYINASYRATQDGFSLIRFLKMDAATQGNTFGVDTTRIVSGGMGTGGEVSLAMAFLDRQEELNLAKFIHSGTMQSYVDTSLSGDVYGVKQRPLNMSNNPSYGNTFQMAFNLGGSVADSSWIESGGIPTVSMSSSSDPFSPFDYGPMIYPTNGGYIINCSGAEGVQRRQEFYGNNSSFSNAIFTDPYTAQANTLNNGMEGLYPFALSTSQNSPWMYWDQTQWNIPHPISGTINDVALLTNPDMSSAKAHLYLDTIVNYLCPRIVCALNLPGCSYADIEENTSESFQVFPNPTQGVLIIKTNKNLDELDEISIINIAGKQMSQWSNNGKSIDVSELKAGVYILRVEGSFVRFVKE